MASANLSLKQNRRLLKKRHVRELKSLIYEKAGKTPVTFKSLDLLVVAQIKADIRKEAKAEARLEFFRYVMAIGISLGIVYGLYAFFWG